MVLFCLVVVAHGFGRLHLMYVVDFLFIYLFFLLFFFGGGSF